MTDPKSATQAYAQITGFLIGWISAPVINPTVRFVRFLGGIR